MNKDNSTKMHLIGKVSEAGERHMGWGHGLAELSIGWFDPWIGSGRVGSLVNCKLHFVDNKFLWVGLGSKFSTCSGLGQSADGLGRIGSHKMNPWITL